MILDALQTMATRCPPSLGSNTLHTARTWDDRATRCAAGRALGAFVHSNCRVARYAPRSPHKMGLVPVRPSSPMTITIPTLVVGTQYTMLGFIRSDSYEPNATAQIRCRPGTIGCTCHDSVLLHTPLRVSGERERSRQREDTFPRGRDLSDRPDEFADCDFDNHHSEDRLAGV